MTSMFLLPEYSKQEAPSYMGVTEAPYSQLQQLDFKLSCVLVIIRYCLITNCYGY